MSTEYRVVPEELLKQCKVLAAMQGDGSTEHFKKLEALLAAPVPPAGGEPEVKAWGWVAVGKFFSDRQRAVEAAEKTAVIDVYTHEQITRLQAEVITARKQSYDAGFDTGFANGKEQGTRDAEKVIDALKAEVERLKKLLGQAAGMVNGATDEWHDQAAKELRP